MPKNCDPYGHTVLNLGDDDDAGDATLICAMLSSLGVLSTVILGVEPVLTSKERDRLAAFRGDGERDLRHPEKLPPL